MRSQTREPSVEQLIRIGMDTSKNVFQLHGVDAAERPVLVRKLQRRAVVPFFAKLPPVRIGLEACGGSHHWARTLSALGHEPVLMAPQHVKAYLRRGKHDAADAEATCALEPVAQRSFAPVERMKAEKARRAG